jgi:uncharacterized protein YndB with AHSA1/START domain
MMPGTICKEITIHAPAAHVWQFVGTEAGLRQWWQMDVRLEPKVGGRCTERGLFNGIPYQLDGMVTVYEPPRQLVLVLAGEQPGVAWPTTMQVAITLEETVSATIVRVVHQLSMTLPTGTPMHQPDPVVRRPLRPLPTILNGLPVQPDAVNSPAPGVAGPILASEEWLRTYEARWTTRLINLLHQMQVKGEPS